MKTFAARLPLLARLRLLLLLAAFPAVMSAGEMQAWLMFNAGSNETLMTTDFLEKNHLAQGGWKVSGTGVLQSEGGADTAKLFRMVLPTPKAIFRMLVTSQDEVNARLKAGFVTEGALGYVSLKAGPGYLAVSRFSKGDKLIWLISAADQKWAETNGWKRETNVFWIWPGDYR